MPVCQPDLFTILPFAFTILCIIFFSHAACAQLWLQLWH